MRVAACVPGVMVVLTEERPLDAHLGRLRGVANAAGGFTRNAAAKTAKASVA